LNDLHCFALSTVEKVLSWHFAQTVSVVDVPSDLKYFPGLHVCQAVQPLAFSPADHLPEEHSLHSRSLESVSRVDTYHPAKHVFMLVQSDKLPVAENMFAPHGGVGAGVGRGVGAGEGALLWSAHAVCALF
jgi:hypothetical protein